MLKRVLPFMLTLLLGTALGSWLSPASHRTYRYAQLSNHCRRKDSYGFSNPRKTWSDRTWAIIKLQPEVKYTQAALRNHVKGLVRLRVLLDANGMVSNVVPLNTLPDGLTEAAIEAAWKIEFSPATENGKPISVWVEINHEFKGDGVLSYCSDNVYEKVPDLKDTQKSFR
jgi:TonB family protein